ncbi:hypothetical protein BH10CYA1_BH10CYA1_40330 [soil metagenome]
MLLNNAKDQSSVKIGELLVKAELIDAAIIEAAVSLASRMRVPLGRILSMEGHISEASLQSAIEVQSRIADRLVTLELGVKALQLVAQKGLTLDAAIVDATIGDASGNAESDPEAKAPDLNVVSNAIPKNLTKTADRASSDSVSASSPLPATNDVSTSRSLRKPLRAQKISPMETGKFDPFVADQLKENSLGKESKLLPASENKADSVSGSGLKSGVGQTELLRAARDPQVTLNIEDGQPILIIDDYQNTSTNEDDIPSSNEEALLLGQIAKNRSKQESEINAFLQAGINFPTGSSNRLGDLLISAGMIEATVIATALENGKVTGLPLGLVLVGMGLIDQSLLNNALTAQRLIRAESVSRDRAIHALRAAQLRRQSIHDSLQAYDWYARTTICTLDIGQLMNRAQIITTDQLLNVREQELLEEKSLEELLIISGLADKKSVDAAKELLRMVAEETLFEDQAIVILRRLDKIEGDPVPDFLLSLLDDSDEFEIGLRALLEDAGLLSPQQLEAAYTLALSKKTALVKTLHETGILEDWQLECILKCKESIDTGLFEEEQAIIALLYALEQKLSFEETVFLFGWALPLDLAS